MPCDSVRTTTVEFGAKTDRNLLTAALKELRVQYYDISDEGKLTVRSGTDINLIKREYSKQVVISQASKFGFKTVEPGQKEVRHVRV